MYFPYLRGRQFELIAVRQLLEMELIHENVIPIIEPIKLTPTLTKTLSLYVEKNKEIVLIHNPKVGSFNIEIEKENNIKDKYNSLLLEDCIIKGHIINEKTIEDMDSLSKLGVGRHEMLTILQDRDCLDLYRAVFSDTSARFNLISDERVFRRSIKNNKVLLDDKYNKLARNADYLNKDEFFSEDHLFYSDEGYKGFSDYSIVGSDYTESGFAPFSVAIHIVYFDEYKNLRIVHFVSDSNDDIQDPGGKFYEAVSKLYKWQKGTSMNTYALSEFVKHYKDETYPGLGTVKKLSIMHHIELMCQFIGGGDL